MPTEPIRIDSIPKRAAIVMLAIAAICGAALSVVWAFANTIALKSGEKDVAKLAGRLAPDDPQTHYAVAVQLEKTFEPADIERSLAEFERSAALSPNNFLYWTALGKARERSGDREGAEAALRRAATLAPNYARVRWALGNALLRQGNVEQGFAEIRLAVDGDKSFSQAAAMTAWQVFDGDLENVRKALGESVSLSAALASLLSDQKRFDEAAAIWNGIPPDKRSSEALETGKAFAQKLTEAKRFRLAASVADDIDDDKNSGPAIGRIRNGGFETAVKMQNPEPFDWRIAEGRYPQIALTDGQKSEGGYSLVVVFGTPAKLEFRDVAQTIAVEPGETYSLGFFYKTELKTNAAFRWEAASASDGKRLAASEDLSPAAEWSERKIKFTVPNDTDGIIIRLVREACTAPLCSISGRIWFDDFRLAINQE